MRCFLLFLLPLAALVGCVQNHPEEPQDNKLKILSTIAMVGDLVSYIGGDKVAGDVLINKELDPHSYEFVKGDDEKLSEAAFIFYVGLGLEHGGSVRRYLESSSKAVALGNQILHKKPQLLIYAGHQVDPHIWMDVMLWKEIVPSIVEALSRVQPESSSYFRERGYELEKRLRAVHEEIYQQMQQIPEGRRYLVTCHDAFNYFCRAYFSAADWQKRVFAPEGLAPDGQISLHELRAILNQMKAHDIRVVFPEAYMSLDPLNKIVGCADEEGLHVRIADRPLYSDSIGPTGSYEEMMRHNAGVIHDQLAG